jgi:hypothetical protein
MTGSIMMWRAGRVRARPGRRAPPSHTHGTPRQWRGNPALERGTSFPGNEPKPQSEHRGRTGKGSDGRGAHQGHPRGSGGPHSTKNCEGTSANPPREHCTGSTGSGTEYRGTHTPESHRGVAAGAHRGRQAHPVSTATAGGTLNRVHWDRDSVTEEPTHPSFIGEWRREHTGVVKRTL